MFYSNRKGPRYHSYTCEVFQLPDKRLHILFTTHSEVPGRSDVPETSENEKKTADV